MFNLLSWQFTRKTWFPGSRKFIQQRGDIGASIKIEAMAVLAVKLTGGARG